MNDQDKQTYALNYVKIATEKGLLSMTRLLASDLSVNPYTTIGDFLKNLSDGDLEQLVKIIDDGEKHKNFEDLMLISAMLSAAEGNPAETIDDYHKCMNMMITFIVCESLYRKGLIKLHRENMSFCDDMANKLVAEKLDEND